MSETSPSWLGKRFEILELIGSGGLGNVYRAWDHHLNRAVAVKRMRPTENSDHRKLVEQTWREAMTTACLQHPHIVTIFDYDIDEQGAYVVTELIVGETLETVLQRGPLHIADFHRLTEQIMEGIIAAHTIGLIHRDIKPANFMLARPPQGRFQVKILDFGLAKYLDAPQLQSMDHFNSLMGSIHYMAPEQFQRAPIDPRTDLYSLGCIFYEVLTGHSAFDGESVSALIDAHLKNIPVSVRELRPDASPQLEQWVLKFMEKDPLRRHLSAQAALAALPALPECSLKPPGKQTSSLLQRLRTRSQKLKEKA